MPSAISRTYAWELATQAVNNLTITTPASGALVNSTTLAVVWSFAAQSQYRVQVTSDAAGETILYDSQWVVSAAQAGSFDLSASGLVSNTTYYLRMFAHSSAAEYGQSVIVPFYFGLPTSVNITGLTAVALPSCNPTPFDNPS